MTDKAGLRAAIGRDYFDRIDAGDAKSASEFMHPKIHWEHRSAWKKDDLGFDLDNLDVLDGRAELFDFLSVSAPGAAAAGLSHTITDLILDGDDGAFMAYTSSASDSTPAPFIVWFHLRDGQVDR